MQNKYYIEYLRNGLEELLQNEDTFLIGEDIQEPYGGAFKVSKGLSDKFPEQIIHTPMSEHGFTGMAVGMALAGLRPIVEIMFGDFITLAVDQLVNHASKFRWLYNKDLNFVIRTPMGGYRGYGATHSQSLEKLFFGLPEIHVVAPSIIDDPGILLKNSISLGKPVLFIENKLDYSSKLITDIDNAYFREQDNSEFPIYNLFFDEKDDIECTIIAYSGMVRMAAKLQKDLYMEEEICTKIVAPSLISPLDFNKLYEILKNDENIIIVEEGHVPFGWGDTIISQMYQKGIRTNMKTFGAKNMVIGAAENIETSILPDFEIIKKTIIDMVD